MESTVMPAYMIGKLNVKNHDEYLERYGMPVLEQFQRYGAEILVASPEPLALEGKWDSNWTVVVRFPSMSKAKEFYASEEYAPFLSMRISELTESGALVLVEGFDPGVLGQ